MSVTMKQIIVSIGNYISNCVTLQNIGIAKNKKGIGDIMKLQELKEELNVIREWRNDYSKCTYTLSYLNTLRNEAIRKKFNKRISVLSYSDMCELEMRCANLISMKCERSE